MTEKAIAAETKKQNTIKAKNILDEMRKELGKSESDGGSIVKKVIFLVISVCKHKSAKGNE